MHPQKLCPHWVFFVLRALVSLLQVVLIMAIVGGGIVSFRAWWTARSGTATKVTDISPRRNEIKCTVNGVELPVQEATMCFARP